DQSLTVAVKRFDEVRQAESVVKQIPGRVHAELQAEVDAFAVAADRAKKLVEIADRLKAHPEQQEEFVANAAAASAVVETWLSSYEALKKTYANYADRLKKVFWAAIEATYQQHADQLHPYQRPVKVQEQQKGKPPVDEQEFARQVETFIAASAAAQRPAET